MSINIDWDNLKFEFQPTKSLFISKCNNKGNWDQGAVIPFGDLIISPAACVLHYAQGLIEGMKAQRTKDEKVVIFRPRHYAERMSRGSDRMVMPAYPVEQFVDAIQMVVKANIDYLPPYGKGSLYVRPCLWGTGPVIGVAPAPEYTFLIMTVPVGPYYKDGVTPIKLKVNTDYNRSAPKGIGNVKTSCNYGGTLFYSQEAKKQGFADCLYLDAKHDCYIEEVSGANFFCIKDGKLFTPREGTILSGVTRDSVITLADKQLGMEVIQKDLHIEEALSADEMFCTGTAAVISPIGALHYNGQDTVINNNKVGEVTQQLYTNLTRIQLQEDPDKFDWVMEVSA